MSAQLFKKCLHLDIKRCSSVFGANQSRYYSDIVKSNHLSSGSKDIQNELKEYVADEKEVIVRENEDVSLVCGAPEEHIKNRLVRIYQTSKNSMQSGTYNANCWQLDFDTRGRWENPLIGWTSSGDPLSNMTLQFHSKEAAINYAERSRFQYYIDYERKEKPKVKSYGFNFSWNRRTRVSTK